MRLNSIHFKVSGISQHIAFRPPGDGQDGNTLTVINGENGSGKSSLLRIVSDAALGLDGTKHNSFTAQQLKLDITGSIARTIAISGTHNDRFPLNTGSELRLNSTRFDLLNFHYFGPKQSGNYTSVSKASNTIAHSLLSEEQNSTLPGIQLVELLAYMGFRPKISIEFKVGTRIKKGEEGRYLHEVYRRLSKLRLGLPTSKLPENFDETYQHIVALSEIGLIDRLSSFAQRGSSLTIDVRGGRAITVQTSPFFDYAMEYSPVPLHQLFATMVSLGVLTTKIRLIREVNQEEVQLDELSSGQWHLLYTMINLTANVKHDSLILIDEPENSLHPQWQREYARLLGRMLSHVEGCHIILATHSPLIAASVMPADGNLMRLSRNEITGLVEGKMEDTAYGWLPGDVLEERFELETARPPELADAINDALRLLKIKSESSVELRSAATRIKEYRRYLPTYDPLNPVLDAIADIAFGTEKSSR